MSAVNYLDTLYPVLRQSVGRLDLAALPTPVRRSRLSHGGVSREISVKLDNLSGSLYGGNKLRKLEYLLCPKNRQAVRRFATFGAVSSHHAIATAIYARQLGFACTCFLAHQKKTLSIVPALNMHIQIGTEIVRYGGDYKTRLETLRKHLWGRDARVIPAGGSSWIGTLGFVNAGFELAAQIASGEIPMPQRVYVATGTMGTAAGLALGLALADLPTEVQAVRVSATSICNETVLDRLLRKTASMMHLADPAMPADLADRTRIRLRHAFYAGGYALSDAGTREAIGIAGDQLGISLESTYTGKAMAALLNDIGTAGECLFWNTFDSAPLPVAHDQCADPAALPAEFHRYFD
jgi:D-cysteine desulfhydrase